MSKAWPKARLGEVLRRSEETIQVQPDITYRQITVKLWGKGVVLRGILTGAEIAASRQMVARRGQFILSRIDARNGALGIVPDELDEAIVSNDFPVFDVAADRLLPAYLGWMCKTESFVEECKRASEGTTNRVRLQEENFLAREIPLPPLAEQRRIVARIEKFAAQIHEARNLREQAAEAVAIVVPSGLARIFREFEGKYPVKKLKELCEVVRGGSPRPAGSPIFYGGDIPFMKVGDLTKDDGKYLYGASASVNELGRQHSRYIESDTLMLTNSGATLGVPKITKIGGCFNDGSQAFLNLAPSVDTVPTHE